MREAGAGNAPDSWRKMTPHAGASGLARIRLHHDHLQAHAVMVGADARDLHLLPQVGTACVLPRRAGREPDARQKRKTRAGWSPASGDRYRALLSRPSQKQWRISGASNAAGHNVPSLTGDPSRCRRLLLSSYSQSRRAVDRQSPAVWGTLVGCIGKKGAADATVFSGGDKRLGRLAFLERCRWLRCRAVHRLKAWRLAGGRHSPPQALVPPASLAGRPQRPQATHRGLPSTWPCLAASWSTRAPLPAPPRPRPPGAGAPAATAGTAPAVGPWLGAGPWASSRRARGGRGRPPAPPGGAEARRGPTSPPLHPR